MKLAAYLPSLAAWRRLTPFLALLTLVLLLFKDTVVAMVSIWDRSDTFAHAFLVPPIVVWLAWRRRDALARMASRPAWTAWQLMAAACALWLLGELAGVNAATQFAVVALVVLLVPGVYGWAMARELTFPLLFLFFCVPFGEFMVPQMMDWTADFAALAIRLSGIPIYREGLQFVIPTGNWSVVEACSGVRYLIASFMVGTLFAYLNFQSPLKRGIFMLVSLLMPIVANWVRAYMIVMIGHLSGNKLAAGVDHIIYGWVFFGIVIGLMFMVGARWADPDPIDAPLSPRDEPAAAAAAGSRFGLTLQAVLPALLMVVAIQGLNWRLNQPLQAPLPNLQWPDRLGAKWSADAEVLTSWEPAYSHAAVHRAAVFRGNAAPVGLWVGHYRNQGYDRKMVTSSNNPVDAEAKGEWAQTARGATALVAPSVKAPIRTVDLRGSAVPGSPTAQRLRVWQVYWVDGHWTVSDTEARLRMAVSRLLGRGDEAAVVFMYTPVPATAAAPNVMDAALADFATEALPLIDARLRRVDAGSTPLTPRN